MSEKTQKQQIDETLKALEILPLVHEVEQLKIELRKNAELARSALRSQAIFLCGVVIIFYIDPDEIFLWIHIAINCIVLLADYTIFRKLPEISRKP